MKRSVGAWKSLLSPVLGAAITMLVASASPAQEPFEFRAVERIIMGRHVRPHGPGGAHFGASVALSHRLLIAGAPKHEQLGAAYLFDTKSGDPVGTLSAPDGRPEDGFGTSVALSATRAVVGAPGHDARGADAGAAYVFDLGTGTRLHKLQPRDARDGDAFGTSVALFEDVVLVGAPGRDGTEEDSGVAYLFDARTGMQFGKLAASDSRAMARFGRSVATNGKAAVVGAPGDAELGEDAGAAYLFDLTSLAEAAKLTANEAGAPQGFGWSVAMDDESVIVGALPLGLPGPGAAYLFDAASGAALHKLEPWEGARRFGTSVGISGGIAVIGSSPSETAIPPGVGDHGSAYLFDVATGRQLSKLYRGFESPDDYFGRAVAIDGPTVAVGAFRKKRVYLYDDAPLVAYRNAGTNPASFRSSVPWMGRTLKLTVDVGTTGHTHAYVFGADSHVDLELAGGQRLLALDQLGLGPLVSTDFHAGPLVSIDLPFPADCIGSVGFPLSMQAVHAFGGPPVALSNAQDVIVGGAPLPRVGAIRRPSNELFAHSVDIGGTTIVAGARFYRNEEGARTGAAYLFDAETGAQRSILVPEDAQDGDFVGVSVATDGNRVLVGATGVDHPGGGAAYLFDATTGEQLFELLSDKTDGNFGRAVGIRGSRAVVAARYAAYVFDALTGELVVRFDKPDGAPSTFGISAAIGDGVAIVGAVSALTGGAAYLFDATTGALLHTLTIDPSPAPVFDSFGSAVGISGTRAVVADRTADVYVYDVVTGGLLSRLRMNSPPSTPLTAQFGSSVAIQGRTVLVGAPELDHQHGTEVGGVFVFDAVSGDLIERLVPSVCDADDHFGIDVGFDGTNAVVGSERAGVLGDSWSSAYVFEPHDAASADADRPDDGTPPEAWLARHR